MVFDSVLIAYHYSTDYGDQESFPKISKIPIGNPAFFKCFRGEPVIWLKENPSGKDFVIGKGRLLHLKKIQLKDGGRYKCYGYIGQYPKLFIADGILNVIGK